jgi:hypothetical protein
MCILLPIVTFGISSLVWCYKIHDEMKRHTGHDVGGGLGLLIALFLGIVSPFVVSTEVGQLFERSGTRAPVSGASGLWYLPGMFILIGSIIWFVKTNGALNANWRSVGAQ